VIVIFMLKIPRGLAYGFKRLGMMLKRLILRAVNRKGAAS
jgi:hypothetical protein